MEREFALHFLVKSHAGFLLLCGTGSPLIRRFWHLKNLIWVIAMCAQKKSLVVGTAKWILDRTIFSSKFLIQDNVDSPVFSLKKDGWQLKFFDFLVINHKMGKPTFKSPLFKKIYAHPKLRFTFCPKWCKGQNFFCKLTLKNMTKFRFLKTLLIRNLSYQKTVWLEDPHSVT